MKYVVCAIIAVVIIGSYWLTYIFKKAFEDIDDIRIEDDER